MDQGPTQGRQRCSSSQAIAVATLSLIALPSAAWADYGKANGTTALIVSFSGAKSLLEKREDLTGAGVKSGFGTHSESATGAYSFDGFTWELRLAASAYAVSEPTSSSGAAYRSGTGLIFSLFNDTDSDQAVRMTFTANAFLQASKSGPYSYASVLTDFSINAYGSNDNTQQLSFFPGVPLRALVPTIEGADIENFSYTAEGGYGIVLAPSERYSIFLRKAEIKANAISAIPEPATWTMMLAGLGVVGYGLRGARASARA